MMAVMAVWFTPWAIVDRRGAYAGTRTWCRYARWSARLMVGLRTEVRGPVPTGEVLIAAKHQSFLDIILIVSEVPRPKFVMKAELRRMPILGWYAMRMGCVPVERGRRAQAMRRMLADVEAGRADAGQLIIYPEGTRTAPGEARPYKIGAAVLYAASRQPCVPAACNVGLFWPAHGVMRRPGLAVVEFLPEIAPGLTHDAFLARLRAEVEGASDRLMAEAGRTGAGAGSQPAPGSPSAAGSDPGSAEPSAPRAGTSAPPPRARGRPCARSLAPACCAQAAPGRGAGLMKENTMTQARWITRVATALALALPLAACAPPQSGDLVNANQSQVAQRVSFGTIIGARQVAVQGGNRGAEIAGTAAGGAIGVAAGNQIGGGSGRDAARIIGGVVGAAAGNRAAGNVTTQQSVEWTVQLDNGGTITVIQAQPTFARGQRVQVIQGANGLTRLIPA